MRFAQGNIFDYGQGENSALCIPTNCTLTKQGKVVMGAGLSKIARDNYIGCDEVLGAISVKKGFGVKQFWTNPNLIAFPTKDHWKNPSLISLIEKSCKELVNLQNKKNFQSIYLPRVGCGLGGLNWNEVFLVLDKYFQSDCFVVVDFE